MACTAQNTAEKEIVKNKMKVSWHYEGDRIFFEMSAPTDGWVTIGFNTTSGIKDAYLLMGNVVKGELQVVEHYTLSPGNYKTINSLGEASQVKDIKGEENSNRTTLNFSLPIKAKSKYQKELSEGTEYTLIMAYSQEDDFEHHSIMRTSANVEL
jgi:hypothetical protein